MNNSTAEDTNSPVLMNNGSTTITTLPPSLPNSTPVVRGVGVLCGASVGTTPSSNAGSNTGNLSEDSNTQDSIPSSSGAISPITTTRIPRRGRGGYRGRGRWMYHHHTATARNKQKLKELVKTINNEDLMEVVLPHLVELVSLWEFMLMKVETCNASHPRAHHIYSEFLALHKHVRRVCQEGLQPLVKADNSGAQQNGNGIMDTKDSLEKSSPILKVEDEAIAKSLGLTAGSYEVKDLPVNNITSFHYKYLTSNPNGPQGLSAQKRTIQVVSPDELVSATPPKRAKATSLLLPANNNNSNAPSVVTLAPSATAASSLLTSIVSNSGLSGRRQAGLFRTVAVQQPQGSLLQTVRVQQPNSASLLAVQQPATLTLPVQQQQVAPTTFLRTVSVPQSQLPQPHTVLRTVAVPSPSHQTSLLRLQQPVVATSAAGRQSNVSSGGVVGVSLLNSSPSRPAAILSQHPSLTALKSPVMAGGQNSHILVAAAASHSVTGAGVGDLPAQSQAAQVVSVLPSSSIHTATLSSLLPQIPAMGTTDFQSLAPDDFLDNSDDSLVSSVSGLSSANSSGLVSAHPASLPNGDMPPEVGFSSVVKVNGVSSAATIKSDSGLSQDKEPVVSLGSEDHSSYMTAVVDSLQDDPEEQQLPMVTSAMDSSSTTTSLFIKCENGELYTIASTGETIPLTSTSVDSVLVSGEALPSVAGGVNGLLVSSQEEALPSASTSVNGLLNGSPLEVTSVKVEKDGLQDDQAMLLADDHTVLSQSDPDVAAEADLDLEEGAETTSFTFHTNAALYQTEDGAVIIQNPDGTSFQLQGIGEHGLTLESVQELLSSMASNSGAEQIQTEVQQ